jgi:hypothetical protein
MKTTEGQSAIIKKIQFIILRTVICAATKIGDVLRILQQFTYYVFYVLKLKVKVIMKLEGHYSSFAVEYFLDSWAH